MVRHSPHQSPEGDSFPPGGSLNSLQAFVLKLTALPYYGKP
ncbi:MAG: hypothetical protein ACI4RP_05460 [Acutalibacteraceae bacterium]